MQKDLHGALLCLAGCVSACSGGGGGSPGSEASGNSPPAIVGRPDGVAAVGEFYSFTPTARDPEGRALSFTIRNRPPWADFNSRDGRLSGTPGPGHLGSYVEITISASDGSSKVRLPDFQIDVIGRGSSYFHDEDADDVIGYPAAAAWR